MNKTQILSYMIKTCNIWENSLVNVHFLELKGLKGLRQSLPEVPHIKREHIKSAPVLKN